MCGTAHFLRYGLGSWIENGSYLNVAIESTACFLRQRPVATEIIYLVVLPWHRFHRNTWSTLLFSLGRALSRWRDCECGKQTSLGLKLFCNVCKGRYWKVSDGGCSEHERSIKLKIFQIFKSDIGMANNCNFCMNVQCLLLHVFGVCFAEK